MAMLNLAEHDYAWVTEVLKRVAENIHAVALYRLSKAVMNCTH